MIANYHVFEPPRREVPFSDEAAEVRTEKALAVEKQRPLLVILRDRHIISDDGRQALLDDHRLEPAHLRCPLWHTEADALWVIFVSTLYVIKGPSP